jgi:putative transcriptional regulator
MAVSIGEGDLLIAPPNMLDPRFSNTVILISRHDPDSSLGLCLNKPTEHNLSDVLKFMDLDLDRDPVVYWGGPVAQSTLWMLHDSSWRVENTMDIDDQWSMTSHHEMFNFISQNCWPDRYRLFLGHAGWAPGQLEGELLGYEPWNPNHSWLIAHDPEPDWLLGCDPKEMWSMACSFCSQQTVDGWMSS